MKIIALDLGANLAFAHNGCADVAVAEVLDMSKIKTRAERFARALRYLNTRFKEAREVCGAFDLCIYERPFSRGFDATRSGWGYAGLIEAVAIHHGMAVTDQTPQSVKSWVLAHLGKKPVRKKMTRAERRVAAQAEKDDMLAVARLLGYMGDNEHEGDAWCLLRYAEKFAVKGLGK